MKISVIEAAKVVHEVERAIHARAPIATDAEARIPSPAWEETTPAYRDGRGTEVRAYLDSGIVPETVDDADIFKAVVESLR